MVAGKDAAKPGEGKNSWLTGTAAWNWITVTQYILGIKPTFDGLEIDPCLPETMKRYTVRRVIRDAVFNITVNNPDGRQHGVKAITVDGQRISGNIVKATPGEHNVVVEM